MNQQEATHESTANDRFEVFFDGQCPMCKLEIAMVRKRDKHNRLILTDIAAPDFEATDRPLNTLMREIHGRYPNGKYVTGVEVFREIYQRTGFGKLYAPSKLPVIRLIYDLGYKVFAWLRYQHAMKRFKAKKQFQCDADCDAKTSQLSS